MLLRRYPARVARARRCISICRAQAKSASYPLRLGFGQILALDDVEVRVGKETNLLITFSHLVMWVTDVLVEVQILFILFILFQRSRIKTRQISSAFH